MKNDMAIVDHGRVSVLVFSSPEQRAAIGRLLDTAPLQCTRIAVSPDDVSDVDRLDALAVSLKLYPSPVGIESAVETQVRVTELHLDAKEVPSTLQMLAEVKKLGVDARVRQLRGIANGLFGVTKKGDARYTLAEVLNETAAELELAGRERFELERERAQ